MSGLLHVSDAASLALHALATLAKDQDLSQTVKGIALTLGVSVAHLAKVMQRLEKAGLVKSRRGPQGGFVLNKSPQKITLKQIYEIMEGKIKPTHCLLGQPFCDGECPLTKSLYAAENKMVAELQKTSLATFSRQLKLKNK
jgi:Rrf2 family transcriptional regulator, nitric oxide-sensitive transcriptional repressor